MGLGQATAMVVGIIIGASIFVQPAEIARLVPSVPGVFAVWIVAGLLTLFGALCCAEPDHEIMLLASVMPRDVNACTRSQLVRNRFRNTLGRQSPIALGNNTVRSSDR